MTARISTARPARPTLPVARTSDALTLALDEQLRAWVGVGAG